MTLAAPPASRTLVIPAADVLSLQRASPSRALRWAPLTPGETKDFGIDISAALAPGETVATVAATVSSASGLLQLGAIGSVGAILVVWLSGGSPGEDSLVTVTAVTAGGRTLIYEAMIYAGITALTAAPSTILTGPPGPPTSVAQFIVLLLAMMAALPTTPGASGTAWNNSGIPTVVP
jgi:hypothetical protein